MSNFQQKITRHIKGKKKNGREKAFKTNIINMLKVVVEKVDIVQE